MTTANTHPHDPSQTADFGAEARRIAADMPFPAKALTVAAGFVVFPPLGLVTLGYFIYQSRRRWHGQEPGADPRGFGSGRGFGRCRHGHGGRFRREDGMTGNVALDEKRRETLRQLDEEAQAFAAFRREQRETRDREAFDRFMTERDAKPANEAPKA
jgi:hypothetical protein